MNRLFEGVPVEIILDDFLIHGDDQRHESEVESSVGQEKRSRLNPHKVKLRVSEVKNVRRILSSEGLKATQDVAKT